MVKQFHIKEWDEDHVTDENQKFVSVVSKYAATKEGSTVVQDR